MCELAKQKTIFINNALFFSKHFDNIVINLEMILLLLFACMNVYGWYISKMQSRYKYNINKLNSHQSQNQFDLPNERDDD